MVSNPVLKFLTWKKIIQFPGGRSCHRCESDGFYAGMVSICDLSGETPSQADDGPLFLDKDKQIKRSNSRLYSYNVPVLTLGADEERMEGGTVDCSALESAALVVVFGMKYRKECAKELKEQMQTHEFARMMEKVQISPSQVTLRLDSYQYNAFKNLALQSVAVRSALDQGEYSFQL